MKLLLVLAVLATALPDPEVVRLREENAALQARVRRLEEKVPPGYAVGVVSKHGGASGTVVARHGKKCLVLTNRHVADLEDKTVMVVAGGKPYRGTVVAQSPKHDLSAVVIEAEVEPARLAAAEPEVGAAVRHWGRASGPQQGRLTGATVFGEVGDLTTSLNADYFSVVGDSGAGVFDAGGRLVAVRWGKAGPFDAPLRNECSVRLADVRAFLLTVPGFTHAD